MLNKEELGKAIASAIAKKKSIGAIKTQAEVAKHFNVKPPSINDWKARGTIDKSKIPELFRYFSDVVGPEHWGLTQDEWPTALSNTDQTHSKAISVKEAVAIYKTETEYRARNPDEITLLMGFRKAGKERREDMLRAANAALKTHEQVA